MSMEDPSQKNEGSHIEGERQIEIAAQEAKLGDTNTEISQLLQEAEGRDDLEPATLASITDRYESLTEKINATFRERLKSWTLVGGPTIVAVGALMGNPGGLEGFEIGVTRFAEAGTTAAVVATALWGLARLRVWIKERREKSEVTN
jgi:hypothetical protein